MHYPVMLLVQGSDGTGVLLLHADGFLCVLLLLSLERRSQVAALSLRSGKPVFEPLHNTA
jgi:hypothetical protein